MTMRGGCLCGAVRFEVAGEPAFGARCYCKDCQKETGSGHSVLIGFPDSAVAVSGGTARFERTGDSGRSVARTFCPSCGTTLWGQPEVLPGMKLIRVGTLDDSEGIERFVTAAIFCRSARSWDRPPEGLTHFPGAPG